METTIFGILRITTFLFIRMINSYYDKIQGKRQFFLLQISFLIVSFLSRIGQITKAPLYTAVTSSCIDDFL